MLEAIAAIGAGSTLTLIGLVAWLVYKLVRSKDEQLAARDMLDKERERADAAEGDLRAETSAHAVTSEMLDVEQDLRSIAEAQRNEAQRRVHDLLRQHMRDATDDEIRALTADAFRSPLGVVSVPEARRSDHPTDGLLDPFADVRSADAAE